MRVRPLTLPHFGSHSTHPHVHPLLCGLGWSPGGGVHIGVGGCQRQNSFLSGKGMRKKGGEPNGENGGPCNERKDNRLEQICFHSQQTSHNTYYTQTMVKMGSNSFTCNRQSIVCFDIFKCHRRIAQTASFSSLVVATLPSPLLRHQHVDKRWSCKLGSKCCPRAEKTTGDDCKSTSKESKQNRSGLSKQDPLVLVRNSTVCHGDRDCLRSGLRRSQPHLAHHERAQPLSVSPLYFDGDTAVQGDGFGHP